MVSSEITNLFKHNRCKQSTLEADYKAITRKFNTHSHLFSNERCWSVNDFHCASSTILFCNYYYKCNKIYRIPPLKNTLDTETERFRVPYSLPQCAQLYMHKHDDNFYIKQTLINLVEYFSWWKQQECVIRNWSFIKVLYKAYTYFPEVTNNHDNYI